MNERKGKAFSKGAQNLSSSPRVPFWAIPLRHSGTAMGFRWQSAALRGQARPMEVFEIRRSGPIHIAVEFAHARDSMRACGFSSLSDALDWRSICPRALTGGCSMCARPRLSGRRRGHRAGARAPVAGRPLAELAGGARSAAISVCDITRPVPYRTMLPPLLACLERKGMAREAITILIATGLHRQATDAEIKEILAPRPRRPIGW